MNYPEIDSSKLSEVMKIIEAAASLMEEKDCDSDAEAAKELDTLQYSRKHCAIQSRLPAPPENIR